MANEKDKDVESTQEDSAQAQDPKLRGYKTVCAILGLSMCSFFIYRLLAGFVLSYLPEVAGDSSPLRYSLLYYTVIVAMTYVLPIAFTAFIFRYRVAFRELYKKPRRVARALGTFPAAYGLGYGVALLTLLASFILSGIFGGETHVEQLLKPPILEMPSSMTEIILMVVLIVVAAPLFEEYWVRGIMFDVLKPYGTGMAIIISSVLFGLMHGSLYMFFYSTAFGLALGYIRYATGSLFTVTIIHALVNSISAATLLLQSLIDMTNAQNRVLNTIQMIFAVFVLILIVAGIAVFIAKIPTIRKYRFENPWPDIGPWKKLGTFFVSIPVMIMMVLALNELSGQFLLSVLTER